jgi:WD40 repeat protein
MGDAGNGSTINTKAIEVAATPQTMQAPNAVGVFIPAPYGTDMVHDPKRNILYISAGDEVLRYQMASNSFLPPLVLRGDLRGIDISPDNDLLAVADATDHNGSIGIHLVVLKTGTNTHVTFRAERMESGTYSVAFGADGAVWITSTIQGSGGLWPLRKYLPASKTTIAITTRVSQNTMLAASADREYIAYAEANSSAGDYGRFRCRATQLQPPLQANAFLYEIGISRDGTQLAVPNYAGVILSGSAAQKIDEKETIGAAYHPQRDFVFLARAGISTIAVYETATYTMVKELDFGDKFEWVGNHAFQRGRLRLSSDGKFVFCTVQGGIRCAETGL